MKGDTDFDRSAEDFLRRIRERTPARVIVGRFGGSYPTNSLLELRAAHAAAKDAVVGECDFAAVLGGDVYVAQTLANNKEEYLLRPDLGRRFSEMSAAELQRRIAPSPTFQLVVGDGLSATAVAAQVPRLLPLLTEGARLRGWPVGTTFAIRYCRVGILNVVGDLLQPEIVVLLIGERPGLATAESLSAYMAYRPHSGHTDAHRNLISNIHARGTPPEVAAQRILSLAATMMARKLSGTAVKEELPDVVNTNRIRDAGSAK